MTSEAIQEVKPETEKVIKQQTQELTEIFSASFPADIRLSRDRWARVNLTIKHGLKAEKAKEDFDNLVAFLDKIVNDGDYVIFVGDLRSPFPLTVAVNGDGEVVETSRSAQPANGNGGKKEYPNEFKAGLLTVEYAKSKDEDGKRKAYYKIEAPAGAKFPKFPVVVWPEVLEKAKIDVAKVDPIEGFPLTGWVAVYEKNEKGYPGKVIELRQPDFMEDPA